MIPADKLWPTDKYGFSFAYAVKLNSHWMIKKAGANWEKRNSDWQPSDEHVWCKFVLLIKPCTIKISCLLKNNIIKVEGVSDVNLNLVWEPPWDKDKMSEAAKLELNL